MSVLVGNVDTNEGIIDLEHPADGGGGQRQHGEGHEVATDGGGAPRRGAGRRRRRGQRRCSCRIMHMHVWAHYY